jgi:NRAMP (natural resistance-associated macrophage protein)-like metal ion transporter
LQFNFDIIGCAIAFKLIFGLDLLYGALITFSIVLLSLHGLNTAQSRILEFGSIFCVVVTAICVFVIVSKSDIVWGDLLLGMVPSTVLFSPKLLYASASLLGATLMPHNLYLHSYVVKLQRSMYRTLPYTDDQSVENILQAERDTDISVQLLPNEPEIVSIDEPRLIGQTISSDFMQHIIKRNTFKTLIALIVATLINSSILIISSANFYQDGKDNVAGLEDAFMLLKGSLGNLAAYNFAVGLFAASISSAVTGTLAGQIVMEGFLGYQSNTWRTKLTTRLMAILPALAALLIYGQDNMDQLLIGSQVVLSIQLPFAIWPLIYFVAVDSIMKVEGGESHAIGNFICVLSIMLATLITVLNLLLVL